MVWLWTEIETFKQWLMTLFVRYNPNNRIFYPQTWINYLPRLPPLVVIPFYSSSPSDPLESCCRAYRLFLFSLASTFVEDDYSLKIGNNRPFMIPNAMQLRARATSIFMELLFLCEKVIWMCWKLNAYTQ